MSLDLDGLDGVRRTRAIAPTTPAPLLRERARVITPPPLPDDAPPGVDAAPAPEMTLELPAEITHVTRLTPRTSRAWMALPAAFAIATVLVLVGRDRAPAPPHATVTLPAATTTATATPQPAAAAPVVTALTPPPSPLDVVLPARFAFNRVVPDGDAAAIGALAARCGGDIVLTGHADARGSDRGNRLIALERADAVRALLAARGIDPSRVRIAGAGASEPIASNKSAAGRSANRRVTLSCEPHGGDE